MLSRTSLVFSSILLVPVFIPEPASAQSQSLSRIIPDAILNGVTLPSTPDPVTNVIHTAHFDINNPLYQGTMGSDPRLAQVRQNLLDQLQLLNELNRQVGAQLTTSPLGSSAGGFAFTLNPSLGTLSRSSDSFGPLFTQRAFTVGRRNLSLGLNYLRRTYDTFDGQDLREGDIKFYFPHNDCCPNQTPSGQAVGDGTTLTPFFEGDVLEGALAINLDSDTVSFFANYGITDRFDLGVAVPIVNVDLKTDMTARIMRLATTDRTLIHSFDGRGSDQTTQSAAGSASGIGDITLRGKVRFLDTPGGGLAVSADLRLPTGKEEDLLGTGATQFTATFIGSTTYGKIAPHVNVGYTVSSGISEAAEDAFLTAPPDEFDYSGGVDFAVHPKMSVTAELIGRNLIDVRRLVGAELTYPFTTSIGGTPQSQVIDGFTTESANVNVLLGSVGAKVNLTKTLLFSASVIFSLTDGGLRDAFTPVIGFDYTFAR